MADEKPVIIIKKKGGHGGHHGGAWKVAYADFVTAMMAFFMVMWLVNSAASPTKQAIASYFRKPGLFTEGSGTPLMIGEAGIMDDAYVPPRNTDSNPHTHGDQNPEPPKKFKKSEDIVWEDTQLVPMTGDPKEVLDGGEKGTGDKDLKAATPVPTVKVEPTLGRIDPQPKDIQKMREQIMQQAAQQLNKQLASAPELKELLGLVEIKLEADGLLLEIMDTDKTSMFASGSARIQQGAEVAFSKISQVVRRLPNRIEIVGHTDAKPFSNRPGGYSNWELSADRANAARRLLEAGGVDTERIKSVVGQADRELKNKEDPLAPANRRITLKLKFDPNDPIPAETGGDPVEQDIFEQLKRTAGPAATPSQGASGTTGGTQAPAAGTAAAGPTVAVATPQPEAGTPVPDETPKTAREIIDQSKEEKIEVLPETAPNTLNPEPKGNDKIFGNSPVFGPEDPFANLPR